MSLTDVRDFVQPVSTARPAAGSAVPATEFPCCHTPPRPDGGPAKALKGPGVTRGAAQRLSATAGKPP